MPVTPASPKHVTETSIDNLTILIPGQKRNLAIIQVGLTIAFLTWIFVIFILAGIDDPSESQTEWNIGFYILFIMMFFTWGVMILTFFGMLLNKERIVITSQWIKISRGFLGLYITKEYTAGHIKDLRVSSSNTSLGGNFNYYESRHEAGSLAFDYGAKTYRFGAGIDEAEAKMIIAEIRKKFPKYFTAHISD